MTTNHNLSTYISFTVFNQDKFVLHVMQYAEIMSGIVCHKKLFKLKKMTDAKIQKKFPNFENVIDSGRNELYHLHIVCRWIT